MANPLALIPRDGEEIALRSSNLQVAMLDTVGPGRLLHQTYLFLGRGVEKALGQAAHKLGFGPVPTTSNIENAFGNRQSILDAIFDSFQNNTTTHHGVLCTLKKDCKNLLEYALPSKTPTTRIQAFRSIIILTTRYPGLRRIFLESPAIKKLADDSPNAICTFWKSARYNPDTEARFTLEFAAHCLAKCDIHDHLEGVHPTDFGRGSEEGMGVVDTILVRYCDGVSGFPRFIAVRYLAGILELPTFWSENYHVQKDTMDKLCKHTLRLIEDINPDSVTANDLAKLALLDPDGVDALADAILLGGEKWIKREPQIKDLWLCNFTKLIKMLRGLTLPDLLPKACRRAAGNWEECLKGTVNQMAISNLDYHYEDVHEFVNGSVGFQSTFGSNRVPSDTAEEVNTMGPSDTTKESSGSNRVPSDITSALFTKPRNLWPCGTKNKPSVLHYSFFRPPNNIIQRNRESKIQAVMKHIEEHVPGIKFVRVLKDNDAVIRIAFDDEHPYGNAWSRVGREAEKVSSNEPTMNLPEVTGRGSGKIQEGSKEYGDIMHEFFHVLGMLHENQHPDRPFDISAIPVGNDLKDDGWTEADINDNILPFNPNAIGSYSPLLGIGSSIMNYHIPGKWTKDGTEVKRNNKPSDLEWAWLNLMYPPWDRKKFEQAISDSMDSRISKDHRDSILELYLDGEWDRVRSKITSISNPKSRSSIKGRMPIKLRLGE